MADKSKSGYLIIIRGINGAGEKVRFQTQSRTHEKALYIEERIKKGLKGIVVINYEIYHFQHIKKVALRRAKKCDG